MSLPEKNLQSPETALDIPSHVTSALVVETNTIAENYGVISSALKKGGKASAVVKADAYGVGVMSVSRALYGAGCRDFFVATIEEGLELREALPDTKARIFILNGVLPHTEDLFLRHTLTPVLIHPGQAERWLLKARALSKRLPAVLHIDTGMARTGFSPEECRDLRPLFEGLDLLYAMTHYSSSDDPRSSQNKAQRDLFYEILAPYPLIPTSLGNTHGIALGEAYQGDLVRPGIGLYGLTQAFPDVRSALHLSARIVQVRQVKAGQTVGYGATHRCRRSSRLATLGVGYADGISRALGNKGFVRIQGHRAPILGRISMDFIVVDVTDIPETQVHEGAWAEIFASRESFIEGARDAETVVYNFLVGLGRRYQRFYV